MTTGSGGGGGLGVVMDLITGAGAKPHVLQQSRAYDELPQNLLSQSKNLSPYSHPKLNQVGENVSLAGYKIISNIHRFRLTCASAQFYQNYLSRLSDQYKLVATE